MNPDKSIVEFLCRDENLSLALEVSEAMDAVHERVVGEFLDAMHTGVSAKFSVAPSARNWTFEKDVEERRIGVCILPRPIPRQDYLHFNLAIFHEGSGFYLWYGLSWWGESESGEEPKGFSTEQCKELYAYLVENKFKRTKWNLGWKSIITFKSRKELLLALRQRKGLASQAVEDFWALFEKTNQLTQAANQNLADAIKKK